MESPYFRNLQYNEKVHWPLNETQRAALSEFQKKTTTGIYQYQDVNSLCGARPCSEDALLLARKDRYGLPVDTWISKRSGLLWTSPRLDEESTQLFYQNDYRTIYSGNASPNVSFYCEQVAKGQALISWLSKKLPKDFFSEGTVFDIGCGAGGMLEPFKDLGWETFGCDFGREYIDYGTKKGLNLRVGGINDLEAYGKAKLIMLSHVLEHETAPDKLFQVASKLLIHGGHLVVTLPGVMNLRAYDWQFVRYLQNAHLFHFSKNTLSTLASMNGFRVLSSDETIRMLLVKDEAVQPKAWDSGEFRRILSYLSSPKSLTDQIKGSVKQILRHLGFSIKRIRV